MSVGGDDRDETASLRRVGDAIAGARPDQPAALVLARARIAGALFGGHAGLGRFRVLERLGHGGMGAVYAAYDPQLDRSVALKTVQVPERGHEAALAEAKALAKLAHPNVVPVFDVGIEGDDIYIVMELVRGETLRTWVKDRRVSDVLDAYRQAGQGLAAAHAAGLVHRDFKPDNAIVGTDGRVRVVDFGLACEGSEAQPAAGTPRYMAPEQAAGGAVTSAADQYSLCVALAEALGPEPPRWVAGILERGTRADPAERFPSVAELVRALGRDPARLRRRRIVGALVLVVAAAAFLVGRTTLEGEAAACEGGAAEIAQTWPAIARTAALARVATLSPYGRELAPRLEQQLDDHAHRWAAQRRDACLVHRRGMQSEAQFDRRMACLDRSRAARSALADLVTRSDAGSLHELAVAMTALPDPSVCGADETLLGEVVPPPPRYAAQIRRLRDDLERARIRIAAGRLDETRAEIDAIVAQARDIPHPPLLAQALLVAGQVLGTKEDRDHAVPALHRAWRIAIENQADATAVEAWARWARLTGTSDRFPPPEGAEVIESLAARSSCGSFTRALLYSSIGSFEIARDRRDRARAALARARDEQRTLQGPAAVELASTYRGLAAVTDDLVQRNAILADLESEQTRLLGGNHPETLRTRYRRAQSSVVALSDAAGILSDTCERLATFATLQVDAAGCWAELADISRERGELATADAALDRALRLGTEHNPFTQDVAPYASLWRGNAAAAIREFTSALDAIPPRPGEPWFTSFERARLTLGLQRALRRIGRPRDPRVLHDVVAALEATARTHPATTVDRLLARARAELAYGGAPAEEAIAAARGALSWWRLAGESPDEIAQLERWLTAVDSPR